MKVAIRKVDMLISFVVFLILDSMSVLLNVISKHHYIIMKSALLYFLVD